MKSQDTTIKLNSSIILNLSSDSEIQFDIHYSNDHNIIFGSTMVAVNQLITTKKSTSYTLSLVLNENEVGLLVMNIVKQYTDDTDYLQLNYGSSTATRNNNLRYHSKSYRQENADSVLNNNMEINIKDPFNKFYRSKHNMSG